MVVSAFRLFPLPEPTLRTAAAALRSGTQELRELAYLPDR